MDLKKIICSEVNQKEKDKCRIMSFICGISSATQMNLSIKQKQTHRHREQSCGYQGGGAGGGTECEPGVSRCTLLYV